MHRLLALAAAVALACSRPSAPPVAAYRALVQAVRARDADAAWSLLSSTTQAWLDARAKAASARAPGVVPASGKELLLGSAAATVRPPHSVVVVRESADRAVLQVTEAEGAPPRDVVLVKEGHWRVEIPEPRP
jgi:hypothetical protein